MTFGAGPKVCAQCKRDGRGRESDKQREIRRDTKEGYREKNRKDTEKR